LHKWDPRGQHTWDVHTHTFLACARVWLQTHNLHHQGPKCKHTSKHLSNLRELTLTLVSRQQI
jgi:hypothetical protein